MASSCQLGSCHGFPQGLLYLSQKLDQIAEASPTNLEKVAKEKSAAFKVFSELLSLFQLESVSPAMRRSFIHLNDKFYRLNQRIPSSSQPLPISLPHCCEKTEDYLALLLLTNRLEEIEWSLEDQLADHPISEAFFKQIKLASFECHSEYLLTVYEKMQVLGGRDQDFVNANLHFLEKYDRLKTKILFTNPIEIGVVQGAHLSEPTQAKIRKMQSLWLEMDQNFTMTGQTKNAVKNVQLYDLAKGVMPLLQENGFHSLPPPLDIDIPYHVAASAYIEQCPFLKPVFLQLMNHL
jgi:hypothetical protein